MAPTQTTLALRQTQTLVRYYQFVSTVVPSLAVMDSMKICILLTEALLWLASFFLTTQLVIQLTTRIAELCSSTINLAKTVPVPVRCTKLTRAHT
jgi:hypothetical protein